MKVLIPGISGVLGRMVAGNLIEAGHDVIGIDRRPWRDAPREIEMHDVDIRKRAAEEVFRRVRPDAVIHMATVTHLVAATEERYRINLGGTRAVFDYCHAYGVRRVVFVGRHTYYGADADSPLYHTESEPPTGNASFPELADLVAADLYAGSALWRYPELETLVLRACYTLGSSHHGTLAAFLSGKRVPMILGFDPLFQFMHEVDAARAIVAALESRLRGVYNVAGPDPLPLSVIVRAAGRQPLPVPEPVFNFLMGRFGLPSLSPGAIAHIKYPIVIDGKPFRRDTGFQFQHDARDAIDDFAAERADR